MIIDAENNSGIIVLSNVSAKNKYNTNIDQLSFELIKTLE
jgi:hypothetical protein